MVRLRLPKQTVTLLIVPDSGAEIRSFRVSLAWVRNGIVAACLLVVMTLLTVAALQFETPRRWVGLPDGSSKNALTRQNELLKERVQSMDADLDRLRRRVRENELLETRLRGLANLPAIDPEVRQMGVGGPDFSSLDPLAQLDPEGAENVVRVSRSADELLRQAEFQRYSFLEIVENLEKSREQWARVPSTAPVRIGWISSGFGRRKDPFTEEEAFHRGLDMSAPRGTPIYATADGKVTSVGRNGGYGITVRINHGDGIETMYAHVQDPKVKRGQKVRRGQEIAGVGTSGRSTAPHVHYEVRVNGRAVNPRRYILPTDEVVD